jgi:hypothetical protein
MRVLAQFMTIPQVNKNVATSGLPVLAVVSKLREHPHPAFGHLLPQAGEGEIR